MLEDTYEGIIEIGCLLLDDFESLSCLVAVNSVDCPEVADYLANVNLHGLLGV